MRRSRCAKLTSGVALMAEPTPRLPGSPSGLDAYGMPHGCCDEWPECSHVYYATHAWQGGTERYREAVQRGDVARSVIDWCVGYIDQPRENEIEAAWFKRLDDRLREARDLLTPEEPLATSPGAEKTLPEFPPRDSREGLCYQITDARTPPAPPGWL